MSNSCALVVLLIAALLTGCAKNLSQSEARSVALEGAKLLQEHPGGEIPQPEWPSAIASLKPKSVHATSDGLYICTSKFFVEERGFFVPHPTSSIVSDAGTDPSYALVSPGLFSYHIKG